MMYNIQDDATFADPLTNAQGRKQYEAQWWGLKAAFSEIEQLQHAVTSAGNPVTLDLKTRYKVKGIGSEKVIESVVRIHTDAAGQKIVQVEDRWNGVCLLLFSSLFLRSPDHRRSLSYALPSEVSLLILPCSCC